MVSLIEQVRDLWQAELQETVRADRPNRQAPGAASSKLLSGQVPQREAPVSRSRSLFTVLDLPPEERPRERMRAQGAEALSHQELIACLLGRGFSGESVLVTVQCLLARFGSLAEIAAASFEELTAVRGVGRAKAAQLMAAFELGRRGGSFSSGGSGRPLETIQAAGAAARRYLAGRRKEHFILLLLDSRHRLIKVASVSVGSLDMSVVHPRETFQEAIRASAAAILLAHNHPSGDPTPSPEDLELTRRLVEAGKLLGIPVLDHLIIGAGEPVSLRDRGFLEGQEAG